MLRLYIDQTLVANQPLSLPPEVARHVQVLRHQPGDVVTLFNGQGGEWRASVLSMGRRDVTVQPLEHLAVDREMPGHVVVAAGMPANERFDWLVEKATELGVHEIRPLVCERSVLRLSGDRAERKAAHWQGVATAAAEQSGRTVVPKVHAPVTLAEFLRGLAPASSERRLVLTLLPGAQPMALSSTPERLLLLSGPEGGLTEAEEAAALSHGFNPTSLGRRVLRAETAPLVCLARLADG